MIFGRRQFLGAIAGSAASALFPRTAAEAIAPVQGFDGAWTPSLGQGAVTLPSPMPDSPTLLTRALGALRMHGNRVAARDIIGIVDFSAPSREARMQLVDVASGRVLSSHLVAHGRGSDPANKGWVERLSNAYGSEASCSGSFLTGDTYYGRHGRSRRLIGLDPENSLAQTRGIVIHAASYVGPDIVSMQGRVGRSQGCFAVSNSDIDQVLGLLGPGRLLYAAR
jgi:hypothetical protein